MLNTQREIYTCYEEELSLLIGIVDVVFRCNHLQENVYGSYQDVCMLCKCNNARNNGGHSNNTDAILIRSDDNKKNIDLADKNV